MTDMMRATVFHGVDDIRLDEVPKPSPGPGEALVRITLTTICGTDVHILRGEYPVKPGLVNGHAWHHYFVGSVKDDRISGELMISDGNQRKALPWTAIRTSR